MSCATCAGSCCAVFEFADPDDPRFEGIEDDNYLRDMLAPIDLIAAAERLDELQIEPFDNKGQHDWSGRSTVQPHRRLMTCRHWDTSTRLCTAYETRPHMCREYPYYGECDYGCGFELTHEQMWDRALRLGGAEAGTPPNIVRAEN